MVGSLFHVSRCLPAARAFLGRLIAVLRTNHSRRSFPPCPEAIADLVAWSHILADWSGTALARIRVPSSPISLIFHVDAFGGGARSSFAGIGVFCLSNGSFALAPFSPQQLQLAHVAQTYSTLILEFSVFGFLLSTFTEVVRGQVIAIRCDNEGTIAVAQKGFHASPVMGSLCRVLAALLVFCNCFVPSQDNLADHLSRGSIPAFRRATTALGWSQLPLRLLFVLHPRTSARSCSFYSEA